MNLNEYYNLSQSEIDSFIATVEIPFYELTSNDRCVMLNGALWYFIKEGVKIDLDAERQQLEKEYVEEKCKEYFNQRKLSVIAERKKKQATIGDLEVIDDKMDDVLLACEYQTCLIELGI